MIGVTRGISTLAGAAVAGILLWFATQVGTEGTGEYWATYGLIASAGLTMAPSQILGSYGHDSSSSSRSASAMTASCCGCSSW